MPKSTGKKRRKLRAILSFVLLAILIALAVLLIVNRDWLTSGGLRRLFTGGSITEADEFFYNYYTENVFAWADGSFISASTSGLQILGPDGEELAQELFTMESPVIATAGDRGIAYDAGGTAFRLFTAEGEITSLTTDAAILRASINSGGHIAIVTRDSGYRAVVTVYSPQLEPIYQWYSRSSYITAAAVSPAGGHMAVANLSESGGSISFFDLTSTEVQHNYTYTEGIPLDLHYMAEDRICLVGETSAVFLDDQAQVVGQLDYGSRSLSAYSLGGDGFSVLALSDYQTSSSTGALIALDTNGNELGRLETSDQILALDARGQYIAVLYADRLVVYDRTLTEVFVQSDAVGALDVLACDDGAAILVYRYSAQVCRAQ